MKSKKENLKNIDVSMENKKIFILVVAIIVSISIIYLITTYINFGKTETKSVESILKNKETAIIYVENSDSKKCKDCAKIKKYLDEVDLKYDLYDAKKASDKEYEDMLKSLGIEKTDFNYPAVIYIKDGVMYSNIINLNNTSVVKRFIADFDLLKVNK